jgi:predicted ribosome quality control (RQC) complex YloA/Tae2 family protein
MKKSLSSLEIHYLIEELKILLDQRVDKIYNPEKKELLIQFHVTGKGKKMLRITDSFMYLVGEKEDASEPSGFCMFLRKQLGNSRLRKISQLESERIVEMVFETKQGERSLIIELFAPGNTIITDEKHLILSAAENKKFRDREIRPKVNYKYPKRPVNIFNLKLKELENILKKSDKENIVKALAVDLGFGGTYSEEICSLANIDKNSNPKETNEKKILDAVSSLLKKKLQPKLVYEDNEPIDVIPFELEKYRKNKTKEFKTFNEALDFYLNSVKEIKKAPKERQIEKIKRIIGKQEEKIKELEEKQLKEREKGDIIYQNYQLIDEILKEINKAKEKYSWQEIKDRLKGHKIIKEANIKDKRIKVEV